MDFITKTTNTTRFENLLYNAIICLLDFNITEYNGLDDEEFIEFVCDEVGMSKEEYKTLMKIN